LAIELAGWLGEKVSRLKLLHNDHDLLSHVLQGTTIIPFYTAELFATAPPLTVFGRHQPKRHFFSPRNPVLSFNFPPSYWDFATFYRFTNNDAA